MVFESAQADIGAIDRYPLSPLQHGMLFHYLQSGRETGVDIEQLDGRLHESIDGPTWVAAWQTIADRHPILRTRFRWEGVESPHQEVVASVAAPVELHDLSAFAAAEQSAHITAFLQQDRRRGFDLGSAPLWRVTLFRLGVNEQRMIWTYAHAILDSAYAQVLGEVFDVYEAALRGERPRLVERPAYRDHILWLENDRRTRADQARDFWRARLAGFVTPTNLDAVRISDSLGHAELAAGHDQLRFSISRDASEAIRRTATERGLRVSTFVEGAWALVLGAFSGEQDVIFGSTRAGRRSSIPDADRIVGLFINTVPVRATVPSDKRLLTLLSELRALQVAVRPFEHTPLVDVVAQAEVAPGTPLFETIIVFNERDNDSLLKSFGDAWHTRDFELHDQTNFPMNVMAYDEPCISFKLSYARNRFERDTVERIADLLGALLEAMAQQPEVTLGQLPRLPSFDSRALKKFNATDALIPEPACIHLAFEAQVDRTPDAVAVVFRNQTLTYRELDERANRVAQELIGLGVGADTMVGLYVERSIEMVVGMLAILKAGGAYVPMDPAYPRERIGYMLEDTQAPVVLTFERLRAGLPATPATVLSLDGYATASSPIRPIKRSGRNNLAYVIFTSGSTGRPKGVQIEHRNVANFFGAMDAELGTTPGVWLALTSISFDISVLEILWTLARGFKVVIQEEAAGARGPARSPAQTRAIGFSLFYFAADAGEDAGGRYRLLLEGAKFADAHGFEAVWTPERHFHPFGGLYPNPAVTGAAVAAVTQHIQIRAGSVVLPLHNPIRCAEEWSVVDNLSNGRVGLSFASGWHASDFALAPENFKNRRELMTRGIETVRALWRGESVAAVSGDGSSIDVKMYPPPVQREPRIWITASGSPETFAMAGRTGASILTNLLVMKPDELVANVAVYRKAYRESGHPGDGHVTLMLHTYVGQSEAEVRDKVRGPFLEYLRTSTDLINKARWELTAFAKADDRSAADRASMNLDDLSAEDMNALLDHAFERYFASAGLFGTPESCLATVDRLRGLGVDEIACLIDFGVDSESVLASLPYLDQLRRLAIPEMDDVDGSNTDNYSIATQIRRHGVTHLQCTPSLLSMIALDDDAVAALRPIEHLLVGGEALPRQLVDRLEPMVDGKLHNMYGPTEATVWSTTCVVKTGTPITVGHPIANTDIQIVDSELRPIAVGVPGELLIGGEGVVRGYLERPDLTAERFVDDAVGPNSGRYYRTGDLARWLPSGEIEFLGRLDHQVKIRGYRIELGEIESVISKHDAVRESIVVARDAGTDGARLVAYVVPSSDQTEHPNGSTQPSNWQVIWDATYRDVAGDDPSLNTAGWKSSFTGEEIPSGEMREWADHTVDRILSSARSVSPQPHILEIGTGTGMLLLRLAPQCEQYTGVDFSPNAIARVQTEVEKRGLTNVHLERLAAHELACLTDAGPFDAVVLNSIIQYFPDASYLEQVLQLAMQRLAPGGVVFVGDVRSLAHLRSFHTAIELSRADGSVSVADVRSRIERRFAEEGELALDPRFFDVLVEQLADAVVDRVDLKAGRSKNEMTAFRYDVVLRKDISQPALRAPSAPAPTTCTLESLRALLMSQPRLLRVTGIPNARLSHAVRASELIGDSHLASVSDVQAAANGVPMGLEPDDLRALDPAYEVTVEFSTDSPGKMDAVFRHRTTVGRMARATAPGALESYANQPATRASAASLQAAELRAHVRRWLPEYMVPAAFVVLDAFPLTPNGKIDRKALPAPDRVQLSGSKAVRARPGNEIEQRIAAVLRQVIGIDEVGVEDNFFDMGANSLLMVQASVRLRTVLGRPVPLVRMFQHPTVRSLAAGLANDQDDAAGANALKQSQDRGQARREAMQRLRELRLRQRA